MQVINLPSTQEEQCSFCKELVSVVGKLFRGQAAYICPRCVRACKKALEDHKAA